MVDVATWLVEMMEGKMQREAVSIKRDKQLNDRAPTARFRVAIFNCGDCLFLIFVSMTATLAMHLVHMSGWHLAFVLPVGTVLAMVIQILLAMAVAPVLGSIESMVPSMLVAMAVPMFVCLFDVIEIGMSGWGSVSLGAIGGLGVFLLIKLYGHRYKESLCGAFPPERG